MTAPTPMDPLSRALRHVSDAEDVAHALFALACDVDDCEHAIDRRIAAAPIRALAEQLTHMAEDARAALEHAKGVTMGKPEGE